MRGSMATLCSLLAPSNRGVRVVSVTGMLQRKDYPSVNGLPCPGEVGGYCPDRAPFIEESAHGSGPWPPACDADLHTLIQAHVPEVDFQSGGISEDAHQSFKTLGRNVRQLPVQPLDFRRAG